MPQKAFQDYYPDDYAHCYGCGRLNQHGLQIKSYWEGEESICTYLPREEHIAIPGYVYGGLIASLIDCHGTGTAAAASLRQAGLTPQESVMPRFLTASLHVDYMHPTPLGVLLELRGKVVEVKGRKVIVEIELSAAGKVTASGRVIAVQVPDTWKPE